MYFSTHCWQWKQTASYNLLSSGAISWTGA